MLNTRAHVEHAMHQSAEEAVNDLRITLHSCESVVKSRMAIGQLQVIESQQM